MRVRFLILQILFLLCGAALMTGCEVGAAAPVYTKQSLIQALKDYGVTAHYPVSQGKGKLLTKAKGERHLVQIDYIDHYKVEDGWVEIYLYANHRQAYEDSLSLRKAFEERARHDAKIAQLQGKDYEKLPMPLIHHGNLLLFAPGIADNKETMQRINQVFGNLKYQ